MQLLKQSTASTVYVGPVLDSAGAAVTTAVVGDFRLVKNGTAATLSGATVTHDANGYYTVALTTTNTDTTGRLTLAVGNTAMSMSTHRYSVLLASVYDALITNATNATGGLPTATGAISALAGAISTYAGGDTSGVTTLLTRLPSAISLSAGAVTVGTNNDKTGYSLASGGLASVTAWSVAITGNITGNLSGSVGSVTSGVTVSTNNDKTGYSLSQAFPTNFASMSIDANGKVLLQPTQTGVTIPTVTSITNGVTASTVSDKTGYSLTQAFPSNFSALAIAAGTGAVTVKGDAFGNTLVLTNLANASQIPAEFTSATFASTGVFSTAALANAPAGGGGSTDWTANERTAIRSILGIPTSGTTPTDPTVGILDTIRDTVGSIGLNVYPVSASTPERVSGTTLTFYLDESRSVSIATDFTLTSMTLEFTVEDSRGNDVYVVADGSIVKSSQTATVPITSTVTGSLGQYAWSLRDITTGNSVIARGVLSVQNAASND